MSSIARQRAERPESGPEAIEWPDLDVDLEIESLRHPERYPLVIT